MPVGPVGPVQTSDYRSSSSQSCSRSTCCVQGSEFQRSDTALSRPLDNLMRQVMVAQCSRCKPVLGGELAGLWSQKQLEVELGFA